MLTVLLVLLVAQIIDDLLYELHKALEICEDYARVLVNEIFERLLVLIALRRLTPLVDDVEAVLHGVESPTQICHKHFRSHKVLSLSLLVGSSLVHTVMVLLPVNLFEPLVNF